MTLPVSPRVISSKINDTQRIQAIGFGDPDSTAWTGIEYIATATKGNEV